MEELVQQCKDGKISSDVLNQQCFKVVDGKLIFRESHMYYYQVQLLLLATNFDACDFVWHSPKEQPSVQHLNIERWTIAKQTATKSFSIVAQSSCTRNS